MRQRIFYLIPVWIIVDIYFVRGLKAVGLSDIFLLFYWSYDAIIGLVMILVLIFQRQIKGSSELISGLMALMVLSLLPKIAATPILLINDLIWYYTSSAPPEFFKILSLAIAAVTLLALFFGLTYGRHRFKLHKITLEFRDMPKDFDGFTITQFSDFHAGSFDNNPNAVKGLRMIADLKSDLLVFTGDLLNSKVEEMKIWSTYFSAFTAKYGKFAVLGNHDYRDVAAIKQLYQEMGFNLLLNSAVTITKNKDTITLIGVENWGKNSRHKNGDLEFAMHSVPSNAFKILLSHDPSHWEAAVINNQCHIQLTLAGHTHGMQLGLELLGRKWSPISYVYKYWAGLYLENSKYLYVNRGFGYLGLKGRFGIWPEVTLITLKNCS